ncbi:hypothetical protein [Sulfobacillus thermosulfidooxidans]|uniref:hypothetical protein n=1 Tax=Sulfobacillus thermosulfidooxidans TaxID=28034 RepID=UPI0006B5DA71|nr:hypothetical protein [Sulfobacillus thermosulfidooxidans]
MVEWSVYAQRTSHEEPRCLATGIDPTDQARERCRELAQQYHLDQDPQAIDVGHGQVLWEVVAQDPAHPDGWVMVHAWVIKR